MEVIHGSLQREAGLGIGKEILDRDLGIGKGEVAGIQGRGIHPTLGVDRPRCFSAGF